MTKDHKAVPTIGDNGEPSLALSEKLTALVAATLDAALKRVTSPDCNGSDLNAAVKIIKEFDAATPVNEMKDAAYRNAHLSASLDDLPDFDESGKTLPPSH